MSAYLIELSTDLNTPRASNEMNNAAIATTTKAQNIMQSLFRLNLESK